MDNKSSDNFINNNVNYGQDKPTPNQYESKNINPEIPDNNINPNQNYDAPNPMNSQNVPRYPYNAPPQGLYNPNYPTNYPPNSYPSYPNTPQAYPYNPNLAVNQYPYNANVGMNVVPSPLVSPLVLNGPNTCCKNMLLVMSIIIFVFLITEISVLNSLGIYSENAFVIVDEVGILIVALLFLISF